MECQYLGLLTMSNTSTYELIYRFAAELDKLNKDLGTGDWDEKVRLMQLPQTQSGESDWQEKVRFMKLPSPSELYPGGKPSKPTIKQIQPEMVQPEPPIVSDVPGESEWHNPESEYQQEEEMIRREEENTPEPDVGYKYHPKEQPYVEYSDEKVLEMIIKDPSHVVTNLMLHRKPEYQKLNLLLPMARSITEWMAKTGISPEQGTPLYDETNYILDLIEQIAEKSKKS